jgi:chemotaxis protein MotB
MMAFFLVMWIVGLSKPVRDAIASYFKNPSGFMKTGTGGKSPLSTEPDKTAGKPSPIMPREGEGNLAALQEHFKAIQSAILREMRRMPELNGLEESVQVQLTDDGLRIELIEQRSSLFFDTGSAKLKPRTRKLLKFIAGKLRTLKNPIVVEGHTDSAPLGRPGGYTNWELSADRANCARRAMETQGLLPGQVIAVRGFADRKPLKPDDPFHFSNRRVSILVAYTNSNL